MAINGFTLLRTVLRLRSRISLCHEWCLDFISYAATLNNLYNLQRSAENYACLKCVAVMEEKAIDTSFSVC